jgi:hypothetical protein
MARRPPVDINEGAKGDQVFRVEFPDDVDLSEYEIIEEARNSATPHLNPIITLSEMKLMIEPALTSQATMAMSPTRMAVPAASAVNRVGSPPEIVPSVEPINSQRWGRFYEEEKEDAR